MREAEIQHSILLAWGSHPRLRLSRQNVGKAQIRGFWVKFGVPGTADIVGLIAPSGRMVQLECKTATGRKRKAQEIMQRVVRSMGGIYEFVRSLEDADKVLIPLVGPR